MHRFFDFLASVCASSSLVAFFLAFAMTCQLAWADESLTGMTICSCSGGIVLRRRAPPGLRLTS
jgi:hypothetical protein